MSRRIRLTPSLTCLLIALFLPLAVSAQTETGWATGKVVLVPAPDQTERTKTTVCAVSESVYSPTFDCANCNPLKYGEDCKIYHTGPDGRFRTQPLPAAQAWYFIPRRHGYTFKGSPGYCDIYGDQTKDTDPSLLQLDQEAGRRGADKGVSADASTPADSERGGPSPFITLVLYRASGLQDFSGGTGEKTITLAGTVTDAQQRYLKDADIFVSDFSESRDPAKSPVVSKAKTGDDGRFRLELPAQFGQGTYIFSITLEGFRPIITSLNRAVACLKSDGAASQSNTSWRDATACLKSDAAPSASGANCSHNIVLTRREELHERHEMMVERLEPTRRHVFRPEVMQTLPLPGTRSFDSFAFLAPGVLPPPETFGGVGPGVSAGVGTAGQFSINGLRSRENNFTADGSDNNDEDIGTRRQGFIMTVPQPVESVKELQVITALGDARYGRNIGGQGNALTQSGAGKFHGTLYGFMTANRFNARDPFDQTAQSGPPSSALRRDSDGANVLLDGAPLVRQNPVGGKDNLRRAQAGLTGGGRLMGYENPFYFFSAERQDIRADKEAHFAVPTVRQRGLFDSGDTGLLLAGTPIFPASVPGDALFSLYPFPNNPAGPYGENTYSVVLPADGHGTRFSFKLDHQFSGPQKTAAGQGKRPNGKPEKPKLWITLFTQRAHVDQITGRYNFTDETSTLPVTGGALFSALRPKVRTQNLAFFVNRTFSDTASDTIRFSVGRTRLSFGERRDASLLPSSLLPGTQFLLHAPLLLNVTKPNADGSLNTPSFLSASGAQGASLLSSLGYSGVTQTEQITGPLGPVFIPGFSPLGVDTENFPQRRGNNSYQVADTVIWLRNKNTFTFGFDWRTTYINSTLDRNFRPRAVFGGLPSANFASTILRPDHTSPQAGTLFGESLAAMGVPNGLFQALAPSPDSAIVLHFRQFSVFFEDQFRVNPHLHVTAGFRYNFNNLPETVSGQLENAFDPAEIMREAQQAANFCNSARCNDLVPALTSAFPADFGESFGGADRSGFDGRIGFAWAPKRLDSRRFGPTVIRGGFGKYSGQFPGVVIDQSRNALQAFLPLKLANFSPRSGDRVFLFNLANPAVSQLSPGLRVITPGTLNQFPSVNPIAFLANQVFNLSSLSLSPTVAGLDLVLPERRLMMPYSLQYGLTVEHQFRNDASKAS